MYQIKFTPHGERDLKGFPPEIRARIIRKLVENASLSNPLVRARPLVNLPPTTHRFRVGKYRISFFIGRKTIFVERVELHGQVYRK